MLHCPTADILRAHRLLGTARSALHFAVFFRKSGDRAHAARCSSDALEAMAEARRLYSRGMSALARDGHLSHHYTRIGNRWRAVVDMGGASFGGRAWISPRTYGKRQSAQRAAAAHIRKLVTSAACAKATP